MMVYRSLVLGLLGAIALLVASPPAAPPAEAAAPVMVADDLPPALSVVDVSRASSRDDLVPLLGLAPGERVVGIGGVPAVTADLVTRWRSAGVASYLDLAVRGVRGEERRILVLVHP